MTLLLKLKINIGVLLAVKSGLIKSWWRRVRLLMEVQRGKKTKFFEGKHWKVLGLEGELIAVGCSERWMTFQEGFSQSWLWAYVQGSLPCSRELNQRVLRWPFQPELFLLQLFFWHSVLLLETLSINTKRHEYSNLNIWCLGRLAFHLLYCFVILQILISKTSMLC